jgi:uncharacterized membrane-anchored protein
MMMEAITRPGQNRTRQVTGSAYTPTRILSRHTGKKAARPLPWRWSVLIITALSTLMWIAILLAAITLLKDV